MAELGIVWSFHKPRHKSKKRSGGGRERKRKVEVSEVWPVPQTRKSVSTEGVYQLHLGGGGGFQEALWRECF